MANMKRLDGRVALITGCNRGLGRSIMDAYVREGANIVACSRKQTEELTSYFDQCERQYGVTIYPLYFDLLNDDAIKTAMKQLYLLKLTIDILVNNAGMLNTDGLLRLSMEKAHAVMQVNYFAPLLITQQVVKLMLHSKSPSIINIASISGIKPTVGNSVYGASKAALINMTTCWAKELASAKIRVNAIAPGYMDSEMTASVDSSVVNNLVADTVLKRLGKTEEIANLAVFLASDDASYIDGETINITGGYRV